MHKMVLVIGGDVATQMDALQADGWCDWWAAGGRYTGALRLKNSAQGKVFGRAMPDIEEWLCQQMGADTRPIGHTVDGGVDQALAGDVDLAAAMVGALVWDGKVELDRDHDLIEPKNALEDVAGAERALLDFDETLRARLGDVPAKATITVVDTHS
jgi:hypothetical protein